MSELRSRSLTSLALAMLGKIEGRRRGRQRMRRLDGITDSNQMFGIYGPEQVQQYSGRALAENPP